MTRAASENFGELNNLPAVMFPGVISGNVSTKHEQDWGGSHVKFLIDKGYCEASCLDPLVLDLVHLTQKP